MVTNYPYTTNIPLGTNKPSVDQPNMQINTNSINSIIGTDHLTFGTATGSEVDGWHTVIHSVPQVSDPVAITGFGQIYTKTVSSDQQLFYESGGGIISQLTSSIAPSTNGFSYLPGRLLIQWGQDALTGIVTYPNAFSASAYSIQLTLAGTQASGGRVAYSVTSSSSTGFNYQLTTANVSPSLTYWIAIGPA